jgi:hypothetical protein
MPNKCKCAGICVCALAVGLSITHKSEECSHGHGQGFWCKQVQRHQDDLPEQHFRVTPPSTGQQQVQLDTGAMST